MKNNRSLGRPCTVTNSSLKILEAARMVLERIVNETLTGNDMTSTWRPMSLKDITFASTLEGDKMYKVYCTVYDPADNALHGGLGWFTMVRPLQGGDWVISNSSGHNYMMVHGTCYNVIFEIKGGLSISSIHKCPLPEKFSFSNF